MIKINKKVEYALMSLKLAKEQPQEIFTARTVCDRFGAPFDTVARVLQIMNHHGLLQSYKGVKGGYTLSRSLQTVSYKDLVEMIEGKTFMMDCHDGPCEFFKSCNITQPIKRLNDYLLTIFSSLSLEELLAEDNLLALKKIPLKEIENCPVTKGMKHEN